MNQELVLQILRDHEAELRARGVERLRIFGSLARGDQSAGSDVDVAVLMDSSRKWTLLTLGGIYEDLKEMLGTEIDIALLDRLHQPVAERVMQEGIDAF